LNNIDNVFGNCSVGHNLAKINTWLDNDREIPYLPTYRIFYNINVVSSNAYNSEILISKRNIKPDIITSRLTKIQEAYKNDII